MGRYAIHGDGQVECMMCAWVCANEASSPDFTTAAMLAVVAGIVGSVGLVVLIQWIT